MRPAIRYVLLAVAAFVLPQSLARADDDSYFLRFAWESFWQQGGYPRPVAKWREPIRVKFSGASIDRHKTFAMGDLAEVAEVAGISISEAAADDASANMVVEVMATADALPRNQPCQTRVTTRNGAIARVHIQATESALRRCMLHEAMHAMGVPGHPLANSVLTYFGRSGRLNEIDKRLLRLIYSEALQPNMSPFAALAVIARDTARGTAGTMTPDTAAPLLRKIVADMERFANGTGEPPAVIILSSKATAPGLARGQLEIQFYLGLAYLNGHIVERDQAKAVEWLTKAASASHVQARRLLDKVNTRAPADVASNADVIRSQ
jgi:hypothetical protein